MMVVLAYFLMCAGWAMVCSAITGAGGFENALFILAVGVLFFLLGMAALRGNARPPSSKRRIVGWLMIPTGVVCGIVFACFVAGNVLKDNSPAYAGMLALALSFFVFGVCLVDGRMFGADE